MGAGYPGQRANRVVGWKGVKADCEEAYAILEDYGRFYTRSVCGWASCLVAQPDFVYGCICSKTYLSHEQGILIIKPESNKETMTHAEREAKLKARQIALVKV